MIQSLALIRPKAEENIAIIRELFVEYWGWLRFDGCFQGFDEELATLPGRYGPPTGCVFLALYDSKPCGCVALREIGEGICEMKRLYVRPAFRGKGIGRSLVDAIIEEAKRLNYSQIRLDTLPIMAKATALYRQLGFVDIPPYGDDPTPGATHMELEL